MTHFTASDGTRIAYYIDDSTSPWKKPDTVLLLHAAMGSAKRYFAWVPRLCGHYRVLRMDMRGHGASEVPSPEKELSMQRLVQDVIELLDHVGCERPHIAGNSAGGYIGQNIAMTRPDRIKSLMLFSSTPGLLQSQWAAWLPRVKEIGLRAFLAENIRARLPVDQLDPKHIEWFLDEADRLDVEFGGRLVTYMTTQDWADRLHEIRCPTFLAIPGAAQIGNESAYEVMRQRIPDIQAVTYEGLPHHITDGVPDRCVDDVKTFLRWRFGAP
ncbi:alpha/beta fold hydrolase [Rhodoferax sediminis]|uniref:Alpha/beta hydrolase n=1 Tax=Rhodoferax sediminis TaxID=2509614 RepID=A0A515DE10_9BURK|nr:alpha/beta hydrolase [Rhodoferax sediminis]QDL38661.1 alpha/beta hydrolase [Rhodoferax sediminis]